MYNLEQAPKASYRPIPHTCGPYTPLGPYAKKEEQITCERRKREHVSIYMASIRYWDHKRPVGGTARAPPRSNHAHVVGVVLRIFEYEPSDLNTLSGPLRIVFCTTPTLPRGSHHV